MSQKQNPRGTSLKKGISTLISAVILIALVFTIASIVSPWLNTLTRNVANETSSSTLQQIQCQSVAYDFDSNFGTSGIINGITNATDSLRAKILKIEGRKTWVSCTLGAQGQVCAKGEVLGIRVQR